MRSDDHAHVVLLHELIDPDLPESHDVLQIEDIVFLVLCVLIHIIILHGITPQDFQRNFVLVCLGILYDFEWSWDLLDFFDRAQCRADASVQTQNGVFDDGSEWHVFEDFIESLINGIRVVDVFSEFQCAFVCEAHGFIESSVFHVASE